MRFSLAIALLAAIAACREAASDVVDREHRLVAVEAPCTGCTLEAPARGRAHPLLVVLHGDNESATTAAARWRATASKRGWAILSLQCPVARGCTETSWYKWAGSPRWVFDQIEAVESRTSIDPRRIYLVGWSGGASFIGSNVPAWTAKFAAMVFHGGGQPPLDNACPEHAIPSYFLVGDRNPAHGAAQRLRDYLRDCGQELRWDLRSGADHAAEDRALDRTTANRILDWLASHTRRRASV